MVLKRLLFSLAATTGLLTPLSAQETSDTPLSDCRITHLDDRYPDVRITIDAPRKMHKNRPTKVIFYALPNGNTIEWTAGKRMEQGDDWHYDIQHIAAQTRFLRKQWKKDYNIVTVYLMAAGKSWGAWRSQHAADKAEILPAIVDDVLGMYVAYHPSAILSSHSGGGYFIFEYIRVQDRIPESVERIVFLDSTYGYEDSLHVEKLADWLKAAPEHRLCVTSYEDATVILDGKHIVSASGGTWGRSLAMASDLSERFPLRRSETDEFIFYEEPKGRIWFKLKKNPEGKIYHTVLVERNGFIDTVLEGTEKAGKDYEFWGERAYSDYIPEGIFR